MASLAGCRQSGMDMKRTVISLRHDPDVGIDAAELVSFCEAHDVRAWAERFFINGDKPDWRRFAIAPILRIFPPLRPTRGASFLTTNSLAGCGDSLFSCVQVADFKQGRSGLSRNAKRTKVMTPPPDTPHGCRYRIRLISTDEIRDLREKVKFAPAEGK